MKCIFFSFVCFDFRTSGINIQSSFISFRKSNIKIDFFIKMEYKIYKDLIELNINKYQHTLVVKLFFVIYCCRD
jgi:hypothetical protein